MSRNRPTYYEVGPRPQQPLMFQADHSTGIIKNLACRLADMVSPDGREELIDLCIKIFQAMKRNTSVGTKFIFNLQKSSPCTKELAEGSPEKPRYNTWCKKIAQSVQSFRELHHERLAPWINWERELD